MHNPKKERESIAKLLFEIYMQIEHNDDLLQTIDDKLTDMEFKVDVTCDPFGRLCLLDTLDNNRDIHKNPL